MFVITIFLEAPLNRSGKLWWIRTIYLDLYMKDPFNSRRKLGWINFDFHCVFICTPLIATNKFYWIDLVKRYMMDKKFRSHHL